MLQSSKIILKKIKNKPEIAVILGSGLSNFFNSSEIKENIPYSKLPDFIKPTVKGHSGNLVTGIIAKKNVICMYGRSHIYEGNNPQDLKAPIRVLKDIGCKILIITNAAGCLNKDWTLGSLMLIKNCIDFTFQNSNLPVYYFDNKSLIRDHSKKLMNYLSSLYPINQGTYSWVLGPTYETPSEIQEIKKNGGDVVGMSTMPEIIKAYKYGMDIIGLSCLSNYASGISEHALTHQDVLKEVNKSKNIFTNLLLDLIKLIQL